jgi:hypothetical protein
MLQPSRIPKYAQREARRVMRKCVLREGKKGQGSLTWDETRLGSGRQLVIDDASVVLEGDLVWFDGVSKVQSKLVVFQRLIRSMCSWFKVLMLQKVDQFWAYLEQVLKTCFELMRG